MATKYDNVLEQFFPGCTQVRADDSANVLAALPQQLTNIEVGMIKKEYLEAAYRNIVPVKGGYSPGLNGTRFYTSEEYGEAKEFDPSADDLPEVGEKYGYVDVPFRHVGDSYSFSDQDLAAAAQGNHPLEASKADTAGAMIERKCDKIAALGTADGAWKGALNNASIPTLVSGGFNTLITGGFQMKIVGELLQAEATLLEQSGGTAKGNVLVMSAAMRGLLARTFIQGTYNRETVLSAFQELSSTKPKIVTWEHAKVAGPGNSEMIAFLSADEGYLQMGQSRDKQVLAPERRGFRLVNHVWSSITPVVVKRPLGHLYITGISA